MLNIQRNLKLFGWFNFFQDFRLFAPIAIIYFTRVCDGNMALGMSVFSVQMLSSAIAEVPSGIISDYIGRKKTMMVGAGFSVMAFTFYALGFNYWFLLVGAILEGIQRAFHSGNNDAFLHDTLEEMDQKEKFTYYHGKFNSMFQWALALSALLGGLLLGYSFSLIMWLSVLAQLMGLTISLFFVDVKLGKNEESTNIFVHLKKALVLFKENMRLRYLTIGSAINFSFGEASYQFQAVFLANIIPTWAITVYKAATNVLAAIGFRLADKFNKKLSAFKIMIYGNIFERLVNTIAVLLNNIFSPFIMALTSLTFGITGTNRESVFQKQFTKHQRATIGSLVSLINSLAFAVVSVGIGIVGNHLGANVAMLIFGLCMLMATVFYYLAGKENL